MGNLTDYAKNEFKAAGWIAENGEFEDDMQKCICKDALAIISIFEEQGHSGTTAPYLIDLLSNLLMYKPLTPLTGADAEWKLCDDGTWQNIRYSKIFKTTPDNSTAYNINAVVFFEWYENKETGEKEKMFFTSKDSRKPVQFPYIPSTCLRRLESL